MNPGVKAPEERLKWFLEQISDRPENWMVPIEPFPFVIGRDEDCGLALHSKWISRRHAEIRTNGGLLWIRDLGSTNGTFVNQKPIQKAEMIEPGDILSFGKSDFCLKNLPAVREALSEDTCAMDLSDELSHLAVLEPRLRNLLLERAVVPHFQPILNLSDMRVAGYEILGRIRANDLPSDPAELFDLAECLGCATDLSVLFREVGVEVGRALPGSPLLFLNTNRVEMYEMNALASSLDTLQRMSPSNRIVLEISEKAVTDTAGMVEFRSKLTALGIGLAYDDFGVGQTRLVELAKVPPDFLKFDISLIREIHLAPKRLHQMVFTFVRAAQDLGIATLAEGIECLDEGETCRELGFGYAQGFFYGRPVPFNEVAMS